MNNKLKNFPVVNFPNLYESPDRKEYMLTQLDQLGLKSNIYQTDRYEVFKDTVKIDCSIPMTYCHFGPNISFLNLLKQWYDQNDEQYGLFCDDDISFETIEHWGFSWQDFLDHLPENWQCVQLIRINSWVDKLIVNNNFVMPDLRIRQRSWDDWGSASLYKRGYVKKLLDRHIRGKNHYNFSIPETIDPSNFLHPMTENLMFREISNHQVYSVPILLETQQFESAEDPNRGWHQQYMHRKSYEYYSGLWKLFGKELSIQHLMNIS